MINFRLMSSNAIDRLGRRLSGLFLLSWLVLNTFLLAVATEGVVACWTAADVEGDDEDVGVGVDVGVLVSGRICILRRI